MNPRSLKYTWKNVCIGSGGRITGIIAHPLDPKALYVRTDVGGVYRWECDTARWQAVMDWVPAEHANWYGIESFAIDPQQPAVLYVGAGAYPWTRDQAILKSTDYGRPGSWSAARVPFDISANFSDPAIRWSGERLAVDPLVSDHLLYGTRKDGLWQSRDGGMHWQPLAFPTRGLNIYHPDYKLGSGSGLSCIVFDPRMGACDTPSGPACHLIYVGVTGDNCRGIPVDGAGVYRSQDGGNTWTRLEGGPDLTQSPMRAVVAGDGSLYVTFFSNQAQPNGSVWKFSQDKWADITPRTGINYVGLTVDTARPERLAVAEYCIGRGHLFLSTNGGESWRPEILDRATFDVSRLPWLADVMQRRPEYRVSSPALISTVLFDPAAPGRLWLVDGWSAWKTDDLAPAENGEATHWHGAPEGIEETFVFGVQTFADRPGELVSALADIDGCFHDRLDAYPRAIHGVPALRNSSGLAFSPVDSAFGIRVGESWDASIGVYGGITRDGGRTWTPLPATPLVEGRPAQGGKVAISADGRQIVWLPVGGGPFYSNDAGQHWQESTGCPQPVIHSIWQNQRPLAADPLDDQVFYLYTQGRLYVSRSGGVSFSPTEAALPVVEADLQPDFGITTLGTDPSLTLLPQPRQRGQLWLCLGDAGLFHSIDGGRSFQQVARVQQARLIAFGPPASGVPRPGREGLSFYLYGIVDQQAGLFYSPDLALQAGRAGAAHWLAIHDPLVQMGAIPSTLAGDESTPGRVYVGTYGRGLFIGEICDPAGQAPSQGEQLPPDERYNHAHRS